MTNLPTGQWTNNSTIAVPQAITDLAGSVDTLITALVDVLNVSRTILDVVRTFMIGTLDPSIAILESIVAEIEGYINDIRELGIYISGDFDLKWPFDNLRGGYQAYESRMVSRLLDANDPTRPDFSASESTVGFFMYASANPDSIIALVNLVTKIARFFGKKDLKPKSFTTPIPLDVLYGDTKSIFGQWGSLDDTLDQGITPTVANLRWRMAPPANVGTVYFPQPPPAGFLIEVSTCKDGLQVAYDSPYENATGDEDKNQERRFGLVADTDQRPYKLYGGRGILQEDASLKWDRNGSVYHPSGLDNAGEPKPGGLRTYAYQSSADNVPIPLEALYVDGKYVLQRTFYYDTSNLMASGFAPGQSFAFKLRYEDMPYGATFENQANGGVRVQMDTTPARNVHVRIRAVSKDVIGLADTALASSFAWALTPGAIARGQRDGIVSLETTLDVGNVGPESDVFSVTFPSAKAQAVVDTFATALVLLVLSRSDLTPSTTFEHDVAGQATGLEGLSYLFPYVFGDTNPNAYFKKEGILPNQFRKFLLQRSRAFASDMVSRNSNLNDSLMDAILDATRVQVGSVAKPLADLTWGDLTGQTNLTRILDSLDTQTLDGSNTTYGVACNPLSLGIMQPYAVNIRLARTNAILGIELLRSPGFLMPGQPARETGMCGIGSTDFSPVYYDSSALPFYMGFCRNLILANPSVLSAIGAALGPWTGYLKVRSPDSGAWQSLRLIPQGLPEIEVFLTQITGFLAQTKAGLKAVTDMIVGYITFLETRVLELEAMLERIDALIQYLLALEIPSCDALVVTGNGVDGLVSGFVGAQNKPQDSTDSYGAGAVVVAGGLPTAILDLLLLFFQKKSDT